MQKPDFGDIVLSKLYSIKEISAFLEVSTGTIFRLVRQGKMAAIKVGSGWRIKGQELLDMERRAQQTARIIRRRLAVRRANQARLSRPRVQIRGVQTQVISCPVCNTRVRLDRAKRKK